MGVHRLHPGLTEHSFGAARTKDGLSSYECLCNFMAPLPGMTVIDLACGNGVMCEILSARVGPHGQVIGIDLNEAELKMASNRIQSERNIHLFQESADQLSIHNASADMVVCHMAFMLLTPLKSVVSEISRVLKSGATFGAVIPMFKQSDELFQRCTESLHSALLAETHQAGALSSNVVKMDCESDLRHIFSDGARFRHDISIRSIDVSVTDTPDNLVKLTLPGFYQYHLLSMRARRQVEITWTDLFKKNIRLARDRPAFIFPLSPSGLKGFETIEPMINLSDIFNWRFSVGNAVDKSRT
jgi:2-polyprenyl-3-methyl-5-hydroxy-6-metoxy-1,4-benzoquinol methylase